MQDSLNKLLASLFIEAARLNETAVLVDTEILEVEFVEDGAQVGQMRPLLHDRPAQRSDPLPVSHGHSRDPAHSLHDVRQRIQHVVHVRFGIGMTQRQP